MTTMKRCRHIDTAVSKYPILVFSYRLTHQTKQKVQNCSIFLVGGYLSLRVISPVLAIISVF